MGRPGIALFGPTSSGKTALSLEIADGLARRGRRPVVLNADSRQVYRGMDIGTSKIAPEEMAGVEHRLLDIADPVAKLSLEAYVQAARAELARLADDRTVVPILVGGTGSYVKALVEGWNLRGTERARRQLQSDFPRSESADAHAVLARLDAGTARRVDPRNYEVVINHLLRLMPADGGGADEPLLRFRVYGLSRPQGQIDARVERVLGAQLERGLLDEIDRLDEAYGLVEQHRRLAAAAPSPVLQTHGYREFLYRVAPGRRVLDLPPGELDAARREALAHIRGYTRRQRAWFPKLGVTVVRPGSAGREIVAAFPG